MKKILFLIIISILTSCEEVVDVDLNTAPPRLVIEASIDWIKGTAGNEQTIKLITTSEYYNTTSPVVSGATVFVTNSTGDVFDFIEAPDSGEYVCSNFVPVLNETYTLNIENNGEFYTATEKLISAPNIEDNIEQKNDGGFSQDEIEIKFFYQDDGSVDNYYLESFESDITPFPEYSAASDELFQGNQMFGLFSNEDTAVGDNIAIKLYGISNRYYEYMTKLLEAADSGGLFGTISSTIRGNIINQTNSSNYALGYFRLSEVDTKSYVVQ
ncbi:uncharacterized protein DUF4249 [Tenacibaculum adriaticum]|uniref:Uncharacterized protein DUF4249 n=1 Tax=Tenacibaculum adriaticum TaxID=413713 RepID=A0A5S5DU51_9FLAO|nr:DUF4249 family protein [Tenacibaculum adriaticum]TYP98159.1 uncharacterized protein DUF4249 [Tenacibaculum adriaticum]